MSELKLQKVFVPFLKNWKKETPAGRYVITSEELKDGKQNFHTEWLKEQEGYFLSASELKKFATDFFYWWYNQKGNNTQQGFDDYIKQLNL